MSKRVKHSDPGGLVLSALGLLNAVVLSYGYTEDENWHWALWFTVPMLLLWAFYINKTGSVKTSPFISFTASRYIKRKPRRMYFHHNLKKLKAELDKYPN